MKIAFFGTHGTGKTTLAHELVGKLKKQGVDAGFLSEIARKCPFELNENTTKKAQIWIILSQIIGEIETEKKYDTIVCDRTVLDGYCYYVNKFGRAGFLEPLIKKHLKTYTHLIRVPIREGFLKQDKIRSTDKKFQKDVDKQFDELLKKLDIKYIKLADKSFKTDEAIISEVISSIN